MWKVCQNPATGEKRLIHLGYEVPEGFVEITTTANQNYIEDELKGVVAELGMEYVEGTPLANYFVTKVDLIADEVYTFAVSSPAKLQEYTQAEIDAKAYMANKKVRQPFVVAWAEATGWTDDQAAMDILRTAAIFKGALLLIRQRRLAAKEKIRKQSTNVDVMRAVLAEYQRGMDLLKKQIAG